MWNLKQTRAYASIVSRETYTSTSSKSIVFPGNPPCWAVSQCHESRPVSNPNSPRRHLSSFPPSLPLAGRKGAGRPGPGGHESSRVLNTGAEALGSFLLVLKRADLGRSSPTAFSSSNMARGGAGGPSGRSTCQGDTLGIASGPLAVPWVPLVRTSEEVR